MNDDGYYDGYTKIRLKIPKIIDNFSISLIGQKKYTDYNTREYFNDVICECLKKIVGFSITDLQAHTH